MTANNGEGPEMGPQKGAQSGGLGEKATPPVDGPTLPIDSPTLPVDVDGAASGSATAATVPLAPAEPWLTPASAATAPPAAGTAAGGWAATASAGRAPVRWGGVVWGILLVLFAGGTLFVLSAPSRLAGVELWLASLTPGATWALWIALLGVLIVVFALLGAIRSAQRRRPQPLS